MSDYMSLNAPESEPTSSKNAAPDSSEEPSSYRRQDLAVRNRVFAMSVQELAKAEEDYEQEMKESLEAEKFDPYLTTGNTGE